MDGPHLDMGSPYSGESTKDETSLAILRGDKAQKIKGNGQTQQFSGVLIKLLKVPLSGQNSSASSVSRDNGADEMLKKPSICWICRRLLECLSKSLTRTDAAFILRSSTSNCALNHELLIIIRFFLKEISITPNRIKVESASSGPLRLTLTATRPHSVAATAAHSGQSGLRAPVLTRYKTRSATKPQARYVKQSYDVYQLLNATGINVPETWIPKASHIPENSDSKESLDIAKSWLDDCLKNHPQCRINELPLLPRRVIDVTEGRLRLFAPEHGIRGRWIALSHCWGKTNTFKTTLKTLELHKQGIEWEQLPKTFKDAVLVTRALDVQYLWIDSLCIIQDDGGVDFHAEAAKMCEVYRESLLTIAASCSPSDQSGFLQQRLVDHPIRLNKPQRLKSIHFRRAINHSRMLRDDPIHARAWTYQETILPHRLLSFGSREASWECETLRKCECHQIEYGNQAKTTSNELGREAYRKYTRAVVQGRFYVGKGDGLLKLASRFQLHAVGPILRSFSAYKTYAADLLTELPSDEDEVIHKAYIEFVSQCQRQRQDYDSFYGFREATPRDGLDYWKVVQATYLNTLAVCKFHRYWRRVLVPEYTRRALTNDSDRLIALQAIASDVYPHIVDNYVAGLWEGDIVNQLCWKSADGRGLPAENQSPSWSWASIRGPVVPCLAEEVENIKFEPCVTILGADWTLTSENPCGRISEGSINLLGLAIGVQYIKDEKTGLFGFHAKTPDAMVPSPLKLAFSPDTPLSCQPDGSLTRSAEKDYLITRHHEPVLTALLLFVKIGQHGDACVIVCGLVSRKAEVKTCRRLGIATIRGSDLELFDSSIFRGQFQLI